MTGYVIGVCSTVGLAAAFSQLPYELAAMPLALLVFMLFCDWHLGYWRKES